MIFHLLRIILFGNRKRKSITRKLLESFRESPRSNDHIFAEYVKNKLNDGEAEERVFNNIKGNSSFQLLLGFKIGCV